MGKWLSLSLTFVLALPLLMVPAAVPWAAASPADEYSGPYFGEDNFPPGCIRDMSRDNPDNICHHMRTDMNGLDSPQVDVLVLVPVSPTAERDMRIMRQSVEMWEGGLDYLAGEMGLDWLQEGVEFHITVDYIDLEGDGDGGEFTTYPVVDPEIVVIATNPAGGVGIGIDPVDFVFTNEDQVPCHTVQNPFDFEYWENLPGFDSHHETRSGTYNEDCDGAGGNICFAINGAIDPDPETLDVFGLFDLVSHEFGHCMTIGHVGDGAEGDWGVVPTNDIMAYSPDPPERTKCLSTLDVEGVATRMSKYLDVDGDGSIDAGDLLLANDQIGEGGNPFQVQHPDDHLYASGTGSPLDCPQPDLGLVPGERTDWTPTPVATREPVLQVTGPADGTISDDGSFTVTGTVERVPLATEPEVDGPTGTYDDADDDATTPLTEILSLDVAATETHVDGAIRLAELWPSTDLASATTYSLVVDGRRFDSFVRYPIDSNPRTWDASAGAYMDDGTSTWDQETNTVTFSIPRDYLEANGIEAPYFVSSRANVGFLSTGVVDDRAPEGGGTVGVTNARVIDADAPVVVGEHADRVTFEHPDGNVFYPEQSTLGTTQEAGIDPSHRFRLDVTQTSNVTFTLTWTDTVGGTDLDLYVTGAASSGSQGATLSPTETFTLPDVNGVLDITVEPYFVTDPLGSTYTLTADITPTTGGPDGDGDGIADVEDQCPTEPGTPPTGCPDADGDGVPDHGDACPDVAGNGADGCPIPATEHVHVYVDGVLAGSQDVDTSEGADSFAIDIELAEGTHELRIDWEDEEEGGVVASDTRTVTHNTDDDGDGVANDDDVCPGHDDQADQDGDGIPDGCDPEADGDHDGDGVADNVDNCFNRANPDQADRDDDGLGDACDPDIDGDGHSNGKEAAHGTDPFDPASYPGKV